MPQVCVCPGQRASSVSGALLWDSASDGEPTSNLVERAIARGVGGLLNNRRSARVRSEGLERSNPKTGTVKPRNRNGFWTNAASAKVGMSPRALPYRVLEQVGPEQSPEMLHPIRKGRCTPFRVFRGQRAAAPEHGSPVPCFVLCPTFVVSPIRHSLCRLSDTRALRAPSD